MRESHLSQGREAEHTVARILWNKFGLPVFPCPGNRPDFETPQGITIEIKSTKGIRACWNLGLIKSAKSNEADFWVFWSPRGLMVVHRKNMQNYLRGRNGNNGTVYSTILASMAIPSGLEAIAEAEIIRLGAEKE